MAVILGVIAVSLALSSRAACRRSGQSAPWQAMAGLALGTLGILAGVGIFVVALAVH